jgi:hypothetical protein
VDFFRDLANDCYIASDNAYPLSNKILVPFKANQIAGDQQGRLQLLSVTALNPSGNGISKNDTEVSNHEKENDMQSCNIEPVHSSHHTVTQFHR